MDATRPHVTSVEIMRILGAFKSLAMQVAGAAPAATVNEGPRLLVGRAPGAGGMVESPAMREAERTVLDSAVRDVNAQLDAVRADTDVGPAARRESLSRAGATVVDYPGWIGMEFPIISVTLGRESLSLVPVPSLWAVYGRVRYARVNMARAEQIGREFHRRARRGEPGTTADMAALFAAIIPREDFQEGLGVMGGVAMGTGCDKHPSGRSHAPDELFLSILEHEAWRTIMTSIPGEPLGVGSSAVVTRWAKSGGHTQDGIIDMLA